MDPRSRIDTTEFAISCPHCKSEIRQTIGHARANPLQHCPRCKKELRFNSGGMAENTEDAERAVATLTETLREQGGQQRAH